MTTTTTLTIREADVLARQATHLVGTLGHVSEGKSTLIRALTGVKTQRHAKEQERNITIHLGYANCRVWQHNGTGELRAGGPTPPTDDGNWTLTAHLSFVDCPGHEAYLATMLGGASVMDTACLIVAGNQTDVPQPQTLEHLIAAELMGLKRIAVLQNKLDILEEPAIRENVAKIRTFIKDTAAETGGPLLPISAQHGWGVGRVLDWLVSLPPVDRDLNAPARLTCVRSFDVNRPGPWTPGSSSLAGSVIGGTLERGVVAVGDWLEIRPGILSLTEDGEIQVQPVLTRVQGLRCEATELPVAVPGSLIAIATTLDPGLGIANGMVGQRVGVPGSLPPVVGRIRVRFQRLKREDGNQWARHQPGDRLRMCSNVMTTEATVSEVDAKRCIWITLDRPLCLDVDESVAVLRHHAAAGRELLEGVATVVNVTEWPHQLPAEGAALAAAPDRTVEWVPMERPAFEAEKTPTYEDLLQVILAKKEESSAIHADAGLHLPEPATERVPKQTVWLNWPATVEELDRTNADSCVRYADHFRTWLERDMSTTTHQNAEGAMYVRGIWRVEHLQMALRRYVAGNKRCPQCRLYNTALLSDRGIKGYCNRCKTDFPLSA
jgi:translation initiation factor 2 subunit 3